MSSQSPFDAPRRRLTLTFASGTVSQPFNDEAELRQHITRLAPLVSRLDAVWSVE